MDGSAADVIVIGAGIAGASAAAEIAADRGAPRVVLLEAEDRPGYHTTGRSAALLAPSYGPPVIRALTRAALPAFRTAHPGTPAILRPRGALFVARADQMDALAAMADERGAALEPVDAAGALRLLPLLRPGYAQAGLYDAAAADMDVDALHQHYLRRFRAAGGMLVTRARVETLERAGGVWQAGSAAGRFAAPVVVNAAGAWADHVAGLAGVRPVGLVPRRRTAALIAQPAGVDARGWPMGADVGEAFYLKPDAGMLLISPADETPSPPCDAQPEEIDLALCVARIEAAFAVSVQRLARRWAGLRSFVADRTPVAGYAADAPGFFWLAGQGGYGIQTAPALARVAAALAMGRALPEDIAAEGVRAAALAPGRAALV